MLDHVGLEVSDFDRSKAFYEAALAALGIGLMMEPVPGAAGFGSEVGGVSKPYFWIMGRGRPPVSGAHVAFGAPGPRPIYHPAYYGAFVLDPDRNNVEAVCHRPPA